MQKVRTKARHPTGSAKIGEPAQALFCYNSGQFNVLAIGRDASKMNSSFRMPGKPAFYWLWLSALLISTGSPVSAAAQTIHWIRQFGAAATDQTWGVVTDATGIYVVGDTRLGLPGYSRGNQFSDAFVRKYDVDGNELWTREFGSTSGSTAQGVAVDSTGVYVVGSLGEALPNQTSAGAIDAFVRKYDRFGNELWTHQFGTEGGDRASGVAADGTGIYIVGDIGILPNQSSGASYVRKYNANGDERWTRQFGLANGLAAAVAADATGAYVATLGSVFRYDADGGRVWSREFFAYAVAADATGVYAAGSNLRKYDVSGNEVWTRQFNSTGQVAARAVAVDATGVYVAGDTDGILSGQTRAGGTDSFVRKYDLNGNELWTRQFGSAGNDFPSGVAPGGAAVYVVGNTSGALPQQISAGGIDAFVAKLAPPPPPLPMITEGGVVNGASFGPYPAPGSIASIFGSNLTGGATVLNSSFGPDGRLVTSLAGTEIRVNGVPVPVFFATPGQLSIQVPYELAGQPSATIQVTAGDRVSAAQTFFLNDWSPGIFTVSGNGSGTAVALHQDGATPITAQTPATPDEVVTLFVTGLGSVTPPLATGAPSVGNATMATPTVMIGEQDGPFFAAEILFSGTAPGFVGLNQINLRIPSKACSDPGYLCFLSINGATSYPIGGVTIPVVPQNESSQEKRRAGL
jgi:uncharacterized protein (TIGR03437 family)